MLRKIRFPLLPESRGSKVAIAVWFISAGAFALGGAPFLALVICATTVLFWMQQSHIDFLRAWQKETHEREVHYRVWWVDAKARLIVYEGTLDAFAANIGMPPDVRAEFLMTVETAASEAANHALERTRGA